MMVFTGSSTNDDTRGLQKLYRVDLVNTEKQMLPNVSEQLYNTVCAQEVQRHVGFLT